MREPLSPKFIESFVETCMDMGLSKEATAELLQRRSAIHAAEQSPAFADGYYQACSTKAASAAVMVRPGYLEKQAFGAALRTLSGGFGGIARGIGGLAGAAGRGALGAARGNPRVAKAIGGALAAGGAGAGLHHYFSNRYAAPGVPYLSPGGYNPVEEKNDYNNELDRYSRGIAEVNQTIDGAGNRRKVLQQAIASNSPNSAQAMADLRLLDSQVNNATKVRQQHLERLNAQGSTTSSRLQQVAERQKQLRERQNSPFWRGMHWMTFRNPDKSYGAALDKLQGPAADLSRQNQLINDQRRRINDGYLGAKHVEPSSAQMQREFFPTS